MAATSPQPLAGGQQFAFRLVRQPPAFGVVRLAANVRCVRLSSRLYAGATRSLQPRPDWRARVAQVASKLITQTTALRSANPADDHAPPSVRLDFRIAQPLPHPNSRRIL